MIGLNIFVRADFHSAEFSDWTGSPLFVCENGAVILNRMSHVTKILLSKIQSARKILLSGNQPQDSERAYTRHPSNKNLYTWKLVLVPLK